MKRINFKSALVRANVVVDSQFANWMLQKGTESRKTRPHNSKYLSSLKWAMKMGKFPAGSATIVFDKNGKLIEGASVLKAIIQTGMIVQLHIETGASPERVFETGTGRRRTITQAGYYQGKVDCSLALRAAERNVQAEINEQGENRKALYEMAFIEFDRNASAYLNLQGYARGLYKTDHVLSDRELLAALVTLRKLGYTNAEIKPFFEMIYGRLGETTKLGDCTMRVLKKFKLEGYSLDYRRKALARAWNLWNDGRINNVTAGSITRKLEDFK